MKTQLNPKLKLTKDSHADLRIYFFIARSGIYKIPNEAVLAVMAYDLETALEGMVEKTRHSISPQLTLKN